MFANLLLSDEINRATPKTQSALLEAMEELQVTVDGLTHSLHHPFIVIATQNPIEHEGTYPLPEAQLDRFMFNINIDYPSRQEEVNIVLSTTSGYEPRLKVVLDSEKILKFQKIFYLQELRRLANDIP